LLAIVIVAVAFFVLMPISSTQDFDGLFTMKVPLGQHYKNSAWCWSSGALGCKNEYWEENADCELSGDEMVIYYYNNSLLSNGESNVWQHAINGLTTSYFYEVYKNDGNSIILKDDDGMRDKPRYLVGKVNGDGSEVVFVGGHNLDNLKKYADSIEFK
jgi:hypothetical protein